MMLKTLRVEGLRNLTGVNIAFGPGLNYVKGGNGAGKTSLLEAVFLLGRMRSFKVARKEKLVGVGREELMVSGRFEDAAFDRVGVRYHQGGWRVRANGAGVERASLLVRGLPIRVVHEGSLRLLDGGPEYRRGFIDWTLFHVEPGFSESRLAFEHARAQANAAVRAKDRCQAEPWYQELARRGEAVDLARHSAIDALGSALANLRCYPRGIPNVSLEYVRGWRRETSLYEALCEGHRGAEAAGFVKVGPQRGDLAVRREGRDVRGFLSRGQQKLLLYALQAAAERVCRERGTTPAVFLADDWRAELDGDNAADLLRLLESLQGQVVMTGTEGGEELGDGSSPVRMFHVEQGRVSDSAVSL